MADPRRFLNWRIGRVDEWTLRARLVEGELPRSASANDAASLKRWVKLETYRGSLFARHGEAVLELHFARRSEQRLVYRQLASWSRPFVSHLALSGTASSLEGSLSVMRTALPGALKAAPTVVIPQELLDRIEESRRPRLSELADDIVLPSGDGPTMVVTTPVLIGAAATGGAAKVTVHLHRRWRFDCDVVGPPGAQYLLVRTVDDSGGPTVVRDGRLVAIPRAPRVVATVAEAEGADLGTLMPRRHEVIEAWIAYEQLAQDQRLRSVEERRDHHLEYSEVESVSAGSDPEFQVVLASPEVAQQHWIAPEAAGRKKRVRVRAAIEIVDLDQRIDPLRGEVVRFDDGGNGRLNALIKLRGAGRVPPVRGRLVAVEDEGDSRQRERRKRALDRLRSGTCANPDLLGWLLNPASVPDADAGPRAGGTLTSLDEYQRRAVALATRVPSIVLVLGPPGAGKTTVIRSIVEEFRRRVASAQASPEAPAPFRVLVTSVQNEAVDNVAEKVGAAAGIEIWHIGDREARVARAFRLQADAKRIAAEIWRELRDMPRFVAYERLHRLRTSVGLLRHALFEVGIGPEYADRLRALASADERKALTPLLDAQLTKLVAQFDRAPAAVPEAMLTRNSGERGPLASALARLADISTELSRETWAATSVELERVYAALSMPDPLDRPLCDLAERWNDLRRRLRREAKSEFSIESARDLSALRDETRVALTADTVAAAPRSSSEFGDALVSEAHGWLQRAANLVDAEMTQRAQHEEAILYRWVHTLAEEPGRLEQIVENHAMVTTATCQRVDQVRGNQDATEFDVVIVDEAARAGIDVLVPMSLGKSIVLVGDHRQLPPYVDRELAAQLEEGFHEHVDLNRDSLFSWLWGRLPQSNVVSLSRQYRMHEDIGRAVSALFYEPQIALSHHFSEERAELRRPDFGLCANQPLVWLDTSDVLQDPVARAERRINRWPCKEENDYEVDVIIRLLRQVRRDPLEAWRRTEGKPAIGVISFYGDQIALLERRLREDIDPALFESIQIGSVDSFQGREFPLIILSTVRSNRNGFVGFLRLPNRINVAMSRAQRQLIIVGDSSTLAANGDGGIPELRTLFADLRSQRLRGLVQQSAEVVQ